MLFYTCTDIAEKTDLFSFFLSQCLQKAVEFGTIFFFFYFQFSVQNDTAGNSASFIRQIPKPKNKSLKAGICSSGQGCP